MKKRELVKMLNSAGIHNAWDIVSKGHPSIGLQPRESRTCTPSAWTLWIKGKNFKGTAWYQHGSLWFIYSCIGQRKAALQKAIKKAKELFPVLEMVKNPLYRFSYVPKVDLDKAIVKAQQQKGATGGD